MTVQPAPTATAAAPTSTAADNAGTAAGTGAKTIATATATPAAPAASAIKSTEEQVSDSAFEILNAITAESIYDTYKLRKKFPTLYNDSMNSVLCQELDRFNGLLRIIRSSLFSVQRAAAGVEVMSDELELVFTSIFNGQVPNMWKSKSYPTLKSLIDYVSSIVTCWAGCCVLFFFGYCVVLVVLVVS